MRRVNRACICLTDTRPWAGWVVEEMGSRLHFPQIILPELREEYVQTFDIFPEVFGALQSRPITIVRRAVAGLRGCVVAEICLIRVIGGCYLLSRGKVHYCNSCCCRNRHVKALRRHYVGRYLATSPPGRCTTQLRDRGQPIQCALCTRLDRSRHGRIAKTCPKRAHLHASSSRSI